MKQQVNTSKESKSLQPSHEPTSSQSLASSRFDDNRPAQLVQRKLRDGIAASPPGQETAQLRHAMQTNSQSAQSPIQAKSNRTGLPDNLKSGIENLSGFAMDDVKVHYNSSKPAQLQAHAYAQGSDIHLGAGQEKHLPHEAWHVVQQKQGRVKPTRQLKSKVNINDDAGLEKEADVMGAQANKTDHSAFGNTTKVGVQNIQTQLQAKESVVQRVIQNHVITRYDGGNQNQLTFDDAAQIGGGAGGSVHRATIARAGHPAQTRDVIVKKVRHQGEYDMEKDVFQQIHNQQLAGNYIGAIGYENNAKLIVIEAADGSLDHQLPRGIGNKVDQINNLWTGLEQLHNLGFTHGDVSQKNTLVEENKAVLADFGGSATDVGAPVPDILNRRQADYQDFIKTSCNILLGNLANNPGADLFISAARINALKETLSQQGGRQAEIDEITTTAELYTAVGNSTTTRANVIRFLAILEGIKNRRAISNGLVAAGAGTALFLLTVGTGGFVGISPAIYYAAATFMGLTAGQRTFERIEEHDNTIDHG